MTSDEMIAYIRDALERELIKKRSTIDHHKLLDLMWSQALESDASNAPSELMLKLISEKRLQEECYQKRATLRIAYVSLGVAALGVFAALISATIAFGNLQNAINTNSDVRRQDMLQRQKDYSIKFYEHRLRIYSELCELVGRGIVSRPTEKDSCALDDFIVAKLLPFASPGVINETIHFVNIQRALLALPVSKDAAKQIEDEVSQSGLQDCGMRILHLCQLSLREQFPGIEIEMPDFKFSMAERDTIAPLSHVKSSPLAIPK